MVFEESKIISEVSSNSLSKVEMNRESRTKLQKKSHKSRIMNSVQDDKYVSGNIDKKIEMHLLRRNKKKQLSGDMIDIATSLKTYKKRHYKNKKNNKDDEGECGTCTISECNKEKFQKSIENTRNDSKAGSSTEFSRSGWDGTNKCGPERCYMEQVEEFPGPDVTRPEDLFKLELFNNASLPFPIKNKYIEILKIHDFPFERIGPFNKRHVKSRERRIKTEKTRPVLKDALNEANELFTKAGYADELSKWVARIVKADPIPNDPHDYLRNNTTTQGTKVDTEFFQYMDELKNLLAFENELAFELAQIKLLIGMVDEENFGYDGKSRQEWNFQIQQIREKQTFSKVKCLSVLHATTKKQMREERKRIIDYNASIKQAKRDQIKRDLLIWKNYVSPTLGTYAQKDDDNGRVKNWFTCLKIPDTKGQIPVPMEEFDDDDVFREPIPQELKEIWQSRSSSLLLEDFK